MSVGALLIASGCSKNYLPDPEADTKAVAELRKSFAEQSKAGAVETVAVQGTGWATIKGRIKITGTKPELKAIAGGAGGCPGDIPDNQLIVGDGGGLADVGIYADKVTRTHESYANYEPPVFDQKGCMFLSPLFIFKAGAPYIVKNSDSVAHNVNIPDIDNATIGPGETSKKENVPANKAKKSPIGVSCSIHPWMKAYMLPTANPYYVITKNDGTFEIANVPAGENVVFKVFHARNPTKLAAKAGTDEIKAGKITLNLKENETRVLEFEIPASQLGGT